jgi:sugar O-acyltransferase (sialic acid O-acetyltransferase NeuD family)
MSGVILYGTGSSLIADVEESLYRAGHWVVAGVQNRSGPNFLSVPALAPNELTQDMFELPFFAPLFTPGNRREAIQEALHFGLKTPGTLIDPTSILPRNLKIGKGIYINAGCSIGAASNFGDFVLINRGASLGHHVHLDAFVSIGPGVVLAGHVNVGSNVMIGAGATILPRITIGEGAIIGAGTVVTRDVPAECVVIGNPGKIVRKTNALRQSDTRRPSSHPQLTMQQDG